CLAGAFIRVLRHSRFQKSLNAVAHSMGDEATNYIFGVRVVSGRKLDATLASRAVPPGIPAFCDIRLDGSSNYLMLSDVWSAFFCFSGIFRYLSCARVVDRLLRV